MARLTPLARGKQGNWYAKTIRGEFKGQEFPCVHKRFSQHWPHYTDPVEGVPLPDAYVAAIRRGKVLLTDSNPDGSRRRYIGLYEVMNVRRDGMALHFEFGRRLDG